MKHTRTIAFVLLPALMALACCRSGESAFGRGSKGEKEPDPLRAKERMVLVNFDGPAPPRNGDGDGYPNNYAAIGKATISIEKKDAIAGQSLRFHLTEGRFYAQFNPYNYKNSKDFPRLRGFARQYAQDPEKWKFNTYNRLRFWIKVPENVPGHNTNGRANTGIGTYVRQAYSKNLYSD